MLAAGSGGYGVAVWRPTPGQPRWAVAVWRWQGRAVLAVVAAVGKDPCRYPPRRRPVGLTMLHRGGALVAGAVLRGGWAVTWQRRPLGGDGRPRRGGVGGSRQAGGGGRSGGLAVTGAGCAGGGGGRGAGSTVGALPATARSAVNKPYHGEALASARCRARLGGD